MLMILPIITLLSITETTTVPCNVSASTLELRDKITQALNQGMDTSGIQESQCVAVESKWMNHDKEIFYAIAKYT